MRTVSLFLPILLLLGAPLGAGGQNAILGFAGALLIWRTFRDWENLDFEFFSRTRLYIPVFALFAFFLWMCIAGLINPDNPHAKLLPYFAGFLPLMLFPSMGYLHYHRLNQDDWQVLGKVLAGVVIVMGLVCLSQAIFGWQRVGMSFVAGPHRARAMYSHPMTTAYAALVVWPYATARFLWQPRNKLNILFFLSALAMIWTTESRVVQVVALLTLVANVFYLLKGRARLIATAVLVVGVIVAAVTPNPVSRKFMNTIKMQEDHAAQGYIDDRMAFWHAHWVLFLDRPILGYGPHFDEKALPGNQDVNAPADQDQNSGVVKKPFSVRDHAYARIGLADFKKKYSAHNAYLQIAVEGGIIGLCLFLFWQWYLLVHFARMAWRGSRAHWVLLNIWGGFSLGIIMQNAFQDNEVRYCFTLAIIFAFIATRDFLNQVSLGYDHSR